MTAGERFDRLIELMAKLRAPDGCPWDREQTLDSLRPFILEEAYELVDAIDSSRPEAIKEDPLACPKLTTWNHLSSY